MQTHLIDTRLQVYYTIKDNFNRKQNNNKNTKKKNEVKKHKIYIKAL